MTVTSLVVKIAQRLVVFGDARKTGETIEFHAKHLVNLSRDILVVKTPFVEELLPELLPRGVEPRSLWRHLAVHKVLRYVVEQLYRDLLVYYATLALKDAPRVAKQIKILKVLVLHDRLLVRKRLQLRFSQIVEREID